MGISRDMGRYGQNGRSAAGGGTCVTAESAVHPISDGAGIEVHETWTPNVEDSSSELAGAREALRCHGHRPQRGPGASGGAKISILH